MTSERIIASIGAGTAAALGNAILEIASLFNSHHDDCHVVALGLAICKGGHFLEDAFDDML